MSAPPPDRRWHPDRRRDPRGGRRPGDQPGIAPLILIADEESGTGDLCEAILATRRFAVARVGGADEALRVMETLRPDLVIARGGSIGRLAEVLHGRAGASGVPLIVVRDDAAGAEPGPPADGYIAAAPDATTVIEEIRRVLARKRAASV